MNPIPNDLELYLEDFKFFYLDIPSKTIAVMVNNKVQAFKSIFNAYLRDCLTLAVTNAEVIPIADTTLTERLKKWESLDTMGLVFKPLNVPENIISLGDIFSFSKNDMLEINMNIKFDNAAIGKRQADLLVESSGSEQFDKIFIEGKNETGVMEKAELIEKILIKKSTIEIKKEHLIFEEFYSKIKDTLKKELIKIYKN